MTDKSSRKKLTYAFAALSLGLLVFASAIAAGFNTSVANAQTTTSSQDTQQDAASRVAQNKEYLAKAQIAFQRLQTETDPAEIDRLQNEIRTLEQLNMKLYAIEPQLEKRLYAAEKLLIDKYTNVNSTSYVGDNPVDTVFADLLTRSIVLFVNPDKVVPSNLPTESAVDGFPVRVEYGKTEETACVNNSRTEECRPLIGGISVSEQTKAPDLNTLGYKATRSGALGFVIAGHTAVAPLKYIVQPHTASTKIVGQVQAICWSGYATCDGDFAWARASTGISVDDDIFKGNGQTYDISSKRADSGQTVGTFVIKSGAGSGNTLGEVASNSPNNNYNLAKIPVTGGDSGSPIFWESGGNADLFGIITAKVGADYAKYWPQDYIETKIGAIAQTT